MRYPIWLIAFPIAVALNIVYAFANILIYLLIIIFRLLALPIMTMKYVDKTLEILSKE
jgi:hypothetical protein